MRPELRVLGGDGRNGDHAAGHAADLAMLARFLEVTPHLTMFLRSNLLAAGLEYTGKPSSAVYVGAVIGGELAAVVAHCWNGVMLVHAPAHIAELAEAGARLSGRRVSGFIGPWDQIIAARQALGLEDAPTNVISLEDLFVLELDRLKMPAALAAKGSRIECRRASILDLDVLTRYRIEYSVEALGSPAGPALDEQARADVLRAIEHDNAWLLLDRGKPVACSFFNARVPDTVQVGGVYTPPTLRGRGYGRAAVAGSLAAVRLQGIRRSVLFTDKDNASAHAAYEALGYRIAGEYGIILLADAQ